jgi:hypothetical protein
MVGVDHCHETTRQPAADLAMTPTEHLASRLAEPGSTGEIPEFAGI